MPVDAHSVGSPPPAYHQSADIRARTAQINTVPNTLPVRSQSDILLDGGAYQRPKQAHEARLAAAVLLTFALANQVNISSDGRTASLSFPMENDGWRLKLSGNGIGLEVKF